MSKKRNIFYACFTFLFVGVCIGSLTAHAGDSSVPWPAARARDSVSLETAQGLTAPLSGPLLAIDQLLTHVRARDRVHAFSLLSAAQHEKYKGNAENFMKNLRLMYHAVYDHQVYRILTPVTSGADDSPSMLVKIQLVNHSGDETLGVVHVIQKEKGIWEIDGIIIFSNDRARDA